MRIRAWRTCRRSRPRVTLRGIGETTEEALRPVTVESLSDYERVDAPPEFKVRVRRAGSLSDVSVDDASEPAEEGATGN